MKEILFLSMLALVCPSAINSWPYPVSRPHTIPSEWARARAKAGDREADLFKRRAAKAEREKEERKRFIRGD